MISFDLRRIRYFIAVAELGSVTRAAVAKGYDLISVGYAAKLMIRTAADVLEQVFPGRSRAG